MTTEGVAAVQLGTSELPKLKTQIQELTAQVAAMTTQKSTNKPIQCFYCKKEGYIQQCCPTEPENSSILILASWVISLQTTGSQETRFGCP